MIDLKRCPFCGGNDLIIFLDLETFTYAIRCRKCSTIFKQYYAVKEEAVDAWNNRYPKNDEGDAMKDQTGKDKWINPSFAKKGREYIKQKAKEKDMSISEYIRYLLQNDTATTI